MKKYLVQSLALGAFALALAGCASTTASTSTDGTPAVSFPEVGSAWLKVGSFIDVDQLRRIGRGMTKNQVRELISYPHFSEGLFGPKEWNYLFNFRTGKGDEFVTCQYQVVFKDGVSDAMYWKDGACAAYLGPKVGEVVRTVPAISAAPDRFRLSADALFAFDKSGTKDILPNGLKELNALATQLKGNYKRLDTVTVIGHTDRLGVSSYNKTLSIARAATVRDYLVTHGLPQSSLRAFGVGEMQPVAKCADSMARTELIACLQPDRRVELEVTGER